MSGDLQAVAGLLQASLDPTQSRQAEQSLKQEETKPGFSLVLLQIAANDGLALHTRLASALFFKNFVRRNWVDENGGHVLPANEVSTIKSELIGLMVKVPTNIQAQLGDAISIIADSDFYERWDTLVADLVSRLTTDDATVNNGVLQVAHSIFKRWEPLYQSDALYTEINHVLSQFAAPFLQLWQNTDQSITQNENNASVLKAQFSTLDLILKLVYDLTTHDMPPQFEENLSAIVDLLDKYLMYDNAALRTADDDEAGPMENIRAGVLRILVQWTKKYDEDMKPHLGRFIRASWTLLTTLGPEGKYDLVVSRALDFLTTATSSSPIEAEQFHNAETLGQVTEKVVLPNLSLRESDVEMFEDEPIEFIRQDLEGADDDTRRRAATNFLRSLMERFEQLVTSVVMRYVEHFLGEYTKNRSENWKSKDVAVHLFSSIAAKGRATAAKGILSVNPHVNVIDFFQNNIAEDLTNNESHPLLKVDAIKYLYMFRSILSADQWQAAFPLLVQHLNNSNYVVYTYAAIAVDRALYLTTDQQQAVIPREHIIPLARDLLQHLFKLITRDPKPEKVQENEFLIKCVMRVLVVIRDGVLPILDSVLTNVVNITRVIRHNPSNPGFCYYHFETIGAIIRFASPTESAKLEAALFPVLGEILQGQVEEFTPYVFQLFAAMAAASPSEGLSPNFQQLLQGVLVPTLWDHKGDVPALNRLLCNLVIKDAGHGAAAPHTEAILIIFQKLVSSKAYELYAFELIETLVTSLPVNALEPYWVTILQLMLTRLSNSKTEKFEMAFVRFYHLVSALLSKGYGADFFIGVVDRVTQDNVFTPIYTTMILPDTQKLVIPAYRKTAVISLTRTLADSQAFVDRYGRRGWTITCQALLKLLINPPLPSAVDDTIEDRDVDDLAFGAAFTPLATCKRPPTDTFPEVQDVKSWVGITLRDADQRHQGRIRQFVSEKLDENERSSLVQVMAA